MDNANPVVNENIVSRRHRKDTAKSPEEDGSIFALWASIKAEDHDEGIESPSSASQTDLAAEDDEVDPIDAQEIYDLISTISDPEHPLSLGSLAVVNLADIHLTPSPCLPGAKTLNTVLVELTPTVTHCSLATVIGLGVRVRLEQSLPPNFRVDIRLKEGTHSQDDQVNKQLADKERVAAALENATLMGVLRKMLETCK